jgi:hypothetical protein
LAIDEQHVALPKLYGAPAYARPPRLAVDTPRPFDPDDLPIEAVRTDEERDLLSIGPDDSQGGNGGGSAELRPRPLSLRALAGRLRGPAPDAGHSDN